MEAFRPHDHSDEPPHRRRIPSAVARAVAFAIGIAVPMWVAAGTAAWLLLR